MNMEDEKIRKIVKESYGKIADSGGCCNNCGCDSSMSNEDISKSIGYTEKEIASVPEANLGLGCGNPTALAEIKEGETVLDLGSGAGFDCFLISKKVGKTGNVIGVDMTEKMIEKAKMTAKKYDYKNINFRLGEIENLPVDDNSVDAIVSNCVINLAPDKTKVFKESYRVLKKSGKMFISDIVLLKELSEEQKNDEKLLSGCVGGALLKDDYIKKLKDAGFKVSVLIEDSEISKRQYSGVELESVSIKAVK